ncbi:hypothetical protein [Streptomyces sp. NPDC020362]|uniref:hypothetical protein n=1 Tax=unclassified Streptomyces TaxID=2593676 RepID=UPI0033CD478C
MARAIDCVREGAGVLVADRPTTGLEDADRHALARLLAEAPVTVLVATDDPALISLCDRVVDIAAADRHEGAGSTLVAPGTSGGGNSRTGAAH